MRGGALCTSTPRRRPRTSFAAAVGFGAAVVGIIVGEPFEIAVALVAVALAKSSPLVKDATTWRGNASES